MGVEMSLPEPEPEPEPQWANASTGDPYPESAWNATPGAEEEPTPEAEPGFGSCVQGIMVALAVLIFIVGSIGNSLVIIVIVRMKSGRTVTEIFLTSLAIADLLVCLICSPLLVVGILVSSGHTGVSYEIEQFLFYFSSVASIFNLTAITLDRHDAILHPMSRRITMQRCKPILAVIWAASAAVATVIHFIPQEFEVIVLAVCFTFPFAAMVISYARILKVARAAERKVAARKDLKNSSSKEHSKTDKTVKMVIIVVVVFAVSWIPSLISRLLKYVLDDAMSKDEIAIMEVAACLIAYAGSALNFLVYAFMSRRFKTGLSQLLGCNRFVRRIDPTDGDIGKTCVNAANVNSGQNVCTVSTTKCTM